MILPVIRPVQEAAEAQDSRNCRAVPPGDNSRNLAHHFRPELSLNVWNGAKNRRERLDATGGGNVFRHLGTMRDGSRSSQPLRTNRTALGMLSPRACTTFRMRAKLALSYSVAS